jgi:hypothetical protein
VLLRVRHPGRVLLDGTRRRRARWPDPKRPWDPTLGVTTAWDLGISDAMAIVFAQMIGIEVQIIDYLEDTGQGLAYYAKRLGENPIATRNTSCPTTPTSGRSEPVRPAWKRSAP